MQDVNHLRGLLIECRFQLLTSLDRAVFVQLSEFFNRRRQQYEARQRLTVDQLELMDERERERRLFFSQRNSLFTKTDLT